MGGAIVVVYGTGRGAVFAMTETNEIGDFHFENLPPDRYTVIVSQKSRFDSWEVRIEKDKRTAIRLEADF